MRIIATSYVVPENHISNGFLAELGVSEEELKEFPVECRPTVLPLEYIRSSLNKSPKATLDITDTVESPTDLGVGALKKALEKANLDINDIGLLVADTSSQLQTIPCESQRIAAEFKAKITCYDFALSSSAFVTQLRTFTKWKKERLPEYIACVWVHTPTRYVDYSAGLERVLLADGASAAIIATNPATAGWEIERTTSSFDVEHSELIKLSLFGHLKINFKRISALVKSSLEQHLAAYPLEESDHFVFPPLAGTGLGEVAGASSIAPHQVFSGLSSNGYPMGAYPGMVLAQINGSLGSADSLRMFVADAGYSFGEVLLKKGDS